MTQAEGRRSSASMKAIRWERRPDDRPQEILDAALRVFAAQGYRQTRLEEIAEAAGVTKGTIYHYFESKEDLLLQIVEQKHAHAFDRLVELVREQNGPASARIRLVVRKGFNISNAEFRDATCLLLQGVVQECPEVYKRWLATGPVRGWQIVARLIEEGQATGEFRQDADAEVAARMLTSGLMLQLIWQQTPQLLPDACIDADRLLDSAVELFLHGLRPAVTVSAGATGEYSTRG
ncbi:MAG TPA: TetR/AcrR family transcriptional regulator [Gemmatimonadaceae bacterium]|nr:TetR/AcrR family transcriptional regulator [Gemmatimonadaceae bacterium]